MNETDQLFLSLIKRGRIIVNSDGTIVDPRTGQCWPSDRPTKGFKIHEHKIDRHRLVWLGMFGPVPDGYDIQFVTRNVHDCDPFNLRLTKI